MVSFSCEACGDVLTKKKLDVHRNQCRGATFTCLDCMVHFPGTDYRSHTSCISEAQKYQGHLYRDKGNSKRARTDGTQATNGSDNSQAMIPRGAYVEDAPEGDDMNAVAMIDVPPRAPTPPPVSEPVGELPSSVNVFDFLVAEDTPTGQRKTLSGPDERRLLEHSTPNTTGGDSQFSQFSTGDGSQYRQFGYSYGNAPLMPGFERYESLHDLPESQQSQVSRPPSSFVTPGPKASRKEKKDGRTTEKSEKKRKRGNVEELDLNSSKRPVSRDGFGSDPHIVGSGGRILHTQLTGALSRLVTDQEFYDDRIAAGPTPISPMKRSKREKDAREAKDERRKSSSNSQRVPSGQQQQQQQQQHHHTVDKSRSSRRRDSLSSDDRSNLSRQNQRRSLEYPDRAGSVQPMTKNQVVAYSSRAELFMSLITKGPESERGCSVNKALKRFHRERDVHGDDKDDEDKELWRSLRLRRNSRGEIVLFF